MKFKKQYITIVLLFFFYISLVFIHKVNKQEKAIKQSTVQSKEEKTEEKYHLACPFNKQAYLSVEDDKIAKVKGEGHEKISSQALIVSHHLLAKDLINQALILANDNAYDNIIIIGPNHFESGPENIQASFYNWKTKFGWLNTDKTLITLLAMDNIVEINDQNFNTEHSVCSLVSFVKNYFPESKITPFILKAGTPKEQSQKLGKFLSKNCRNCLFIASLDFSHEVSEWQAGINDQQSIEILEKLDEENLDQVTCDSPSTLQVLFSYLKEKNVEKGKLITNSNSNQVSLQNLPTVTSYITMKF